MDAALVLVRLVAFAAGVSLFGAPLFVLYGLPKDAAGPARLKPLLLAAALATALAAAAALVLQTGQMAGDPAAGLDPATLRDVLFSGGFGVSVQARIGAGALALVLLVILKPGRRTWRLATALGTLSLAALAWSGHGAADEGIAGLVHASADVIHLLAAGVWLGALGGFSLMLAAHPRGATIADLHGALAGFSGVGSVVVAALIASGLVNSWFLVGPQHLADLAVSLWSQLLIVKLLLFATMLGFAALNRYRLTPRLAAGMADDPAGALAELRRSLALEGGAGFAVLALVAALGVLAPPASA